MTLTMFLTLLVILSSAVSLCTEAVKIFLDSLKVKYASNVVVLIVAILVGAGGTALMYILLGITFTVPNIICMALMAFAVWVGAMVEYDKVIQLIEQIKHLKV